MSEQEGFAKLQFGVDLGRVLASIDQVKTVDDVSIPAQKIVDALELNVRVNDEPGMLMGLGFGLADRKANPLDDGALELMRMAERR